MSVSGSAYLPGYHADRCQVRKVICCGWPDMDYIRLSQCSLGVRKIIKKDLRLGYQKVPVRLLELAKFLYSELNQR